MASKLPDSSVDTSRKVNVKGMYLAAIEKYVSTLVLDQSLIAKWNSEFEALQEAIVRLHGRFLSKNNAVTIVVDECIKLKIEHSDRTGALSDSINSDLRVSLVGRIKEYIESLPRKYTLRIGLPSFQRWGAATYQISRDIRIVIGNTPVSSGMTLAQMLKPTLRIATPDDLTTYLEFSAIGYSDGSPGSPAVSDCLSLSKQCAFMLTTHAICTRDYAQSKAIATLIDEHTGLTEELTLPDSIARCFGELVPNEEKLLVYDNKGMTFLADTGRLAVTNEEKIKAFSDVLYHTTSVVLHN